MTLIESEAVVLRAQDHGESDRIITFFSPTWGLVRALAKGARRSQKRFVHAFEPNSVVLVSLRRRAELAWVESCRLLNGHLALRSDPLRWAYAGFVVETTLHLNPENLPNPPFYELLRRTLERLESDRDPTNVATLFLVRGLRLLGVLPSLAGCAECGRKIADSATWRLSLTMGRFTCGAHGVRDGHAVHLDRGSAALLQAMLDSPAERMWRYRLRKTTASSLIKAVSAWVEDQTGRRLKSRRLLESDFLMDRSTEEFRQ